MAKQLKVTPFHITALGHASRHFGCPNEASRRHQRSSLELANMEAPTTKMSHGQYLPFLVIHWRIYQFYPLSLCPLLPENWSTETNSTHLRTHGA
jgi:hypothetical protein